MTNKEYHLILFELGLLEDSDDWDLYKKQELRYPVDDSYDNYTLDTVSKSLYNNYLQKEILCHNTDQTVGSY